MSVGIFIAHSAWAPDRKEPLARLLKQVPSAHVVSSQVKEHASVWARRLWAKALESKYSHYVFLNDDIDVCDNFYEVMEAVTSAQPDRMLTFHVSYPEAPTLALQGHSFCKGYWVNGPAYCFPRALLQKFVEWYDKVPDGFKKAINEDVAAICFAWSEQEPVWATIPALVQHRIDVASTLGYDNHPMRQSPVPFSHGMFHGAKLTESSYWVPESDPPYCVNPWAPEQQLETWRRTILNDNWCLFCQERPPIVTSDKGGRICTICLASAAKAAIETIRC